MEPTNEAVARCVKCNSEFTEKELEQAPDQGCCPNCKSKGVPCDPKADVTIKINVHELRILGIWAENWAVQCDNKELDNAYHESLKDTIKAICDRIYLQIPDNLKKPLTLRAEIKELSEYVKTKNIAKDVTLYRDGREEII